MLPRNRILSWFCSGILFSRAPRKCKRVSLSKQRSSRVSRDLRPYVASLGGGADSYPEFMRRLDVVNRGFSGWNTANAVGLLSDIFSPPGQGVPKIDYLVRCHQPAGC
jgi:hypothetical protein